jgi:hypothetical protein
VRSAVARDDFFGVAFAGDGFSLIQIRESECGRRVVLGQGELVLPQEDVFQAKPLGECVKLSAVREVGYRLLSPAKTLTRRHRTTTTRKTKRYKGCYRDG